MTAFGSYTINYDAAGRPAQWPVERPSGNGYGLADLNWDYEGRLTQMKVPGQGSPYTTNEYNGLNTRVKRNDLWSGSKGLQQFRRDGVGVTAPVLSTSSGPSYNQTWGTNYVPGISHRESGTSTYQSSGIKNVDAQSSSGTSMSATREYDAWGNVYASTGTHVGRFGYGGGFGYQEEDSGLKLLGHRFYDPQAGRFLTRDRIKDGRNWYAYCDNNPIKSADPTGLKGETSPEQPHSLPTIMELAADDIAAGASKHIVISSNLFKQGLHLLGNILSKYGLSASNHLLFRLIQRFVVGRGMTAEAALSFIRAMLTHGVVYLKNGILYIIYRGIQMSIGPDGVIRNIQNAPAGRNRGEPVGPASQIADLIKKYFGG